MRLVIFEGGFLLQKKKTALIPRLTEAAASKTGIPEEKFIVLVRELDRYRGQDADGSKGRASGKMNIVATTGKEAS